MKCLNKAKTVWEAEEGYVFQRISDGHIMGSIIYLGKYIEGQSGDIALYREIEAASTEFTNLM